MIVHISGTKGDVANTTNSLQFHGTPMSTRRVLLASPTPPNLQCAPERPRHPRASEELFFFWHSSFFKELGDVGEFRKHAADCIKSRRISKMMKKLIG